VSDEGLDYDMVEGAGDDWMWMHELKELIREADTFVVNQEDFDTVAAHFDITVDEDGYLVHESGEYVKPEILVQIDDGNGTFVEIRSLHKETATAFSFIDDSVKSRMEYDKSTPEKVHIEDLYGVSKQAGDPVFIYNDFYRGLEMDASEWEPFMKVRPLFEHECNICGEEFTNRDYQVPDDAGAYWVPKCPVCQAKVTKPEPDPEDIGRMLTIASDSPQSNMYRQAVFAARKIHDR